MLRWTSRFFADEQSGAISPLYALVLPMLVVMAGIGFDYGRLMALDTELQNAADHAALAAATQLDGRDDAMIRARNAANNTLATASSAFVNITQLANETRNPATDRPITSLSFTFYDGYANDTLGNEITDDANGAEAAVVEVTVNAREVFYALTPVVAAFSSGDVIGRATAMIHDASCDVPPMMFCVPNDPDTGTADTGFPTEEDIGKGMHLHLNANAADPWAPGNFGFLDIEYDISGNPNHTLGLNSDFDGCTGDEVESRTGVRDPEADALNSRFDFYSGSVGSNSCNYSDGHNCPAASVRKDFTVTETVRVTQSSLLPPPAAPDCGTYDSRSGWNANPAAGNFKKDNCFALGTCSVLGDGNWDYTTYFAQRMAFNPLTYPVPMASDFGESSMDEVTRWDVYKWERANAAARLAPERISSTLVDTRVLGANTRYTFENVCAYPEPIFNPPGIATSGVNDRRMMTVAAVDCTGLNGSDVVDILRWVHMFLVQPADISGPDKSFFMEIVDPEEVGAGYSSFQTFSKRRAVLIR